MSKAEEGTEEVKDEKKKKKEKILIQTKVVVRRMPIGMNKDIFMELFGPLPEHDFFRFVPGDRSLSPYNHARAYINFVNADEIIKFRDKYDGCELELKTGQKSSCVVEYAPFQKVPKKGRRKEDPKADTIQKDADYIKFLDSLDDQDEKQTIDIEKFLEELDLRDKQNHKAVETPLTAFVKQRRDERKRVRDERRRLDIERRKKKDEERRKRREAEKKKRTETEKGKRKEGGKDEIDGKKTLGETKREMQNDRARHNSESTGDDSAKMKILQKNDGDAKSKSHLKVKQGVYSASDLEEKWADDYAIQWPDLNQSEDTNDKSHGRYKEGKYRGSSRDFGPRRWKDGHTDSRPPSSRSRDSPVDTDKKEERFKNKKPDRDIYQSGARGRGYRGGRGSRPQKYSEQRSRSARKSESDK